MNEHAYTSGPWKPNVGLVPIFGIRCLGVIREVEGETDVANEPICLVAPEANATQEDWANARLIASALKMLAALQFVLANHHEGHGEFEDVVIAAIESATGEKP